MHPTCLRVPAGPIFFWSHTHPFLPHPFAPQPHATARPCPDVRRWAWPLLSHASSAVGTRLAGVGELRRATPSITPRRLPSPPPLWQGVGVPSEPCPLRVWWDPSIVRRRTAMSSLPLQPITGGSSPHYRGQLTPTTLCNLLTELLFITNIIRLDPVIFTGWPLWPFWLDSPLQPIREVPPAWTVLSPSCHVPFSI
jgi:hypothetical protein